MARSFAGQNILITGGSTGIGLAMAHEFARRGANLALLARNQSNLDAAADALKIHGTRILTFSCDVTDAEALGRAIEAAVVDLGGLDGVVANSGYCHPGNFHEISLKDGARQIDTNLKGCVNTLHFALPHLLSRGGGFVAITSSPAGNAAIYGFSLYGATKAALNNLSHVLRAEYADRGISVHLLLPPDTATPGYDHEVLLYPPETRAILSGGKLFGPETVARRFVRGIERGKKRITVGLETHLLLLAIRVAPFIWELYTRSRIRTARRVE